VGLAPVGRVCKRRKGRGRTPPDAPPARPQSERDNARATLADVQQQLGALQQRHAQQTMQLEAQLREQAAAAAEERLRERSELKQQMER
jgi:spindle assembly abnormal protein 6